MIMRHIPTKASNECYMDPNNNSTPHNSLWGEDLIDSSGPFPVVIHKYLHHH